MLNEKKNALELNELEQINGGDRFDVYAFFQDDSGLWNKSLLCCDRYVLDAAQRVADELPRGVRKELALAMIKNTYNNGEPLEDFLPGARLRQQCTGFIAGSW